jgi:hypothetical protein
MTTDDDPSFQKTTQKESTCLSSQHTFSETRDILEVKLSHPIVEVTERFVGSHFRNNLFFFVVLLTRTSIMTRPFSKMFGRIFKVKFYFCLNILVEDFFYFLFISSSLGIIFIQWEQLVVCAWLHFK